MIASLFLFTVGAGAIFAVSYMLVGDNDQE